MKFDNQCINWEAAAPIYLQPLKLIPYQKFALSVKPSYKSLQSPLHTVGLYFWFYELEKNLRSKWNWTKLQSLHYVWNHNKRGLSVLYLL